MRQSKITFLTSIGAGLEYYDYVIYVIFASFISYNFFPASDHVASLFATFGVFAIGNIIRPLGGIVVGTFGDRFGRKNIFTATLLGMAIATFVMGVTPGFVTIGISATVIFSLCRVLQGIACGVEIPGATTFLLEHTHVKHRGLHFGFMSSAVGLGSSFALFTAWLLTKILTGEQMLNWGFRLPFLFGGVLALVGFVIRKHIPETPAFLALQKTENKFFTMFSGEHARDLFNTMGILIFPACFIMFFLAIPVYLHDVYHYSFPDIFLAMTVGTLWTAFLIPIFGWASDRIVRRKTLLVAAVSIFIIFSFPIFSILRLENQWALFGFILFGKTLIAAMAASYFVLLPQAFHANIRCAGTAFSYNIAYTLAALTPLGVNYSFGILKNSDYIIWAFNLLAMITIISTLRIRMKEDDENVQ